MRTFGWSSEHQRTVGQLRLGFEVRVSLGFRSWGLVGMVRIKVRMGKTNQGRFKESTRMCVCMRASVRVCVRACVCACVCACFRSNDLGPVSSISLTGTIPFASAPSRLAASPPCRPDLAPLLSARSPAWPLSLITKRRLIWRGQGLWYLQQLTWGLVTKALRAAHQPLRGKW